MAVAVSASGTLVPPMFVFPRAKYKDYFMANGPYGCVGSANPSDWMKANDFLVFMQHFVAVTKSSKEHPVLILLDNYESHLSIALIGYCRDNGIVLLTLPSHCSHKLQRLDQTVFGPFKKCVNPHLMIGSNLIQEKQCAFMISLELTGKSFCHLQQHQLMCKKGFKCVRFVHLTEKYSLLMIFWQAQ